MDASAPPDTPPAPPSVGEAVPTAAATTPVTEEAIPLVKKLWRRRGAPADEGIKSEDTVDQPPPRTIDTEHPEDGEAADDGAAPVKKWPALPSRKIAGESFGEMLRQHRDGEVPPTVQPLLQTTNVVKKAKPAKSAAAALHKHIRAPRLLVHVDPKAAKLDEIDATTCPKTVVVVVAEGSDAAAETLSSTATPPQSWSHHAEVLRRATGHEVPSTKDPAAPAEDKTPSVPIDVVKSGAVRKHHKQQQQPQTVAAALSSSQPQPQKVSIPVTITTVKADSAVIALRALRNSGSSDSRAANDHGKPASSSKILEEISKLLRDYCGGSVAAVASTAAVAPKPSLEESGTAVSSTAALDAPTPVALETPEMILYNRLVELCQHPDVTSHTMELLHELVMHTRVIPHEPAAPSAQNHGGEAKAAVGPHEADVQVVRRRQYAQQVILVLLNQVRQRKLQEEYRASVAVRSKLSALSAPFMPAGLQTPPAAAATGPNSNTTTFAAQGTGGSHGGTERSPSQANNTASISEPRVPAAARAHENHSGKSVTMGTGMEALFTAMRERIEASCQTPPTLPSAVRVSAEERQVLRDVQINFRQQQQQQCLPAHLMSSTTPNTTAGDNKSGASCNATYPLSTTTPFDPQAHAMTAPSGRYPNPPLQQRTVFSYHTVRYDPFGAESPVSQTDPPPRQPPLTSTFNHNAKPFVPTGAAAAAIPKRRSGMNAGAPAFLPASVPVAPLPPHAAAPAAATSEPQHTTEPIAGDSAAAEASPPSAPPSTATAASPWATPQMFSQWKEMMESYYHLMTMAQTFRQQQSQSQLPPPTAGRDSPP